MNKLIFIDDSLLDHFILKRILIRYGATYEVNCSADGEEVLNYLTEHKTDKSILPDIILLDLYMPGFNGWDFLEKVQQLYPILAKPFKLHILSASINPKDIARSKQYSCVQSFLFKPITKEILDRLVSEEESGVA